MRAACAILLLGALAAAAVCTCPEAKLRDGWCDTHETGYVAMVAIPSRLLYDTMDAHGHTLDLSTFTCPSCRKAIDADGFCDEHRIGFVRKQAYYSRLTYEMARGTRVDPQAIACPACRKHVTSPGWCDKDGVGMIGNVAIRDRRAFDRAAAAVAVLRDAVAMLPRCQYCSMAMVTDTQCPVDRTVWKNGKPVPPIPPDSPAASPPR